MTDKVAVRKSLVANRAEKNRRVDKILIRLLTSKLHLQLSARRFAREGELVHDQKFKSEK
jgi:hypothetical protein